MKRVRFASGLIGWEDKIQNVYSNLTEFATWCEIYGIHRRLGYKTIRACWNDNPTVQGSTNPKDLQKKEAE